MLRPALRIILAVLLIAVCWTSIGAQSPSPVDTRSLNEMRWRMIGPHRGSRTKAVDGMPVNRTPSTSASSMAASGRRPTAGRTWPPIFDDQPTGSIGAIAVAPSDPNVIYVGTGEGQQRPDLSTGDGIYKSTDARQDLDAPRPARRAADRADRRRSAAIPNRLFVAALGHPYGPNTERGIFRSLDGGQSFEKVLYKDENTGGVDVTLDPNESATSSTRRCGRRGRARGRTATSAARAAACSSRPTAAPPGGR